MVYKGPKVQDEKIIKNQFFLFFSKSLLGPVRPLWDPRGGHKTNFSLFLGVPEKTIFLTVSPKLFFKPFLTIKYLKDQKRYEFVLVRSVRHTGPRGTPYNF